MTTIYQALTTLKEKKIPCSPFMNYDASNEIEYAENGCSFRALKSEWPIHNISYSSRGNLNVSFIMEGVMTEPSGYVHNCKQIKNVTVVKNGKINLQYLQLSRNKALQAQLPADFGVKNNIIDLGKFALTDKTSVSASEIFKAGCVDFVNKMHASPKAKVAMTDEQIRLANLGLRTDGFYCRPVKKIATDVPEHECKVSISGCSSKTTKMAKKLATVGPFPTSNVNELLYTAQVLGYHTTKTETCSVAGIPLNGTVTC